MKKLVLSIFTLGVLFISWLPIQAYEMTEAESRRVDIITGLVEEKVDQEGEAFRQSILGLLDIFVSKYQNQNDRYLTIFSAIRDGITVPQTPTFGDILSYGKMGFTLDYGAWRDLEVIEGTTYGTSGITLNFENDGYQLKISVGSGAKEIEGNEYHALWPIPNWQALKFDILSPLPYTGNKILESVAWRDTEPFTLQGIAPGVEETPTYMNVHFKILEYYCGIGINSCAYGYRGSSTYHFITEDKVFSFQYTLPVSEADFLSGNYSKSSLEEMDNIIKSLIR